MKSTAVLALLLSVVFVSSCRQSRNPDELAIEQFVKEHAHDPASYEPVSFGAPKMMRNSDITGNTTDTAVYAREITHSYRAKNKLGALVLETRRFVIADDMDKVEYAYEEGDSIQ